MAEHPLSTALGDTPARGGRRTFWVAQVGAWTVLGVLMFLPASSFAQAQGVSSVHAALWAAGWGAAGFMLSSALAAFYARLPERYLRGVTAAAAVLLACVAAALIWNAATHLLEHALGFTLGPPDGQGPGRGPRLMLHTLREMLILGTWSAVFLLVMLSDRVRRARERSVLASALTQQAQLRLLRAQINPHFLFNALNSIVALIHEDSHRAQEMVRDVARLLRRAISADDEEWVSLRKELDFIELYLRCEKVRFEERLQVEVDVPDSVLSQPVPAMILHPVVDNAIKHGMRGREPLTVRITGKVESGRVCLQVANTGALRESHEATYDTVTGPRAGTGSGIKSVTERLDALFPTAHTFELSEADGWVRARIEYVPPETGGEA